MVALNYRGALHQYQPVATSAEPEYRGDMDGIYGCTASYRVRSGTAEGIFGCWSLAVQIKVRVGCWYCKRIYYSLCAGAYIWPSFDANERSRGSRSGHVPQRECKEP